MPDDLPQEYAQRSLRRRARRRPVRVLPDQPCVWTQAWRRSAHMPRYGGQIASILPPLDRRQQDRSAWVNEILGLPDSIPQGWQE
jgi:hypothetical protein